jgi:hypothetical protein
MHDIKSKDVHMVDSMARNSNGGINENRNELQTMPSQWTQVMKQSVDKLIRKDISSTCNFQEMKIDTAKAPELGCAQFREEGRTINSRNIITTETQDARGDT